MLGSIHIVRNNYCQTANSGIADKAILNLALNYY